MKVLMAKIIENQLTLFTNVSYSVTTDKNLLTLLQPNLYQVISDTLNCYQ